MSSGLRVARRPDHSGRQPSPGHRSTPESVANEEHWARWRVRFEAAQRTVRLAHPTWDARRVEEEAAGMLGRYV